MGIVRINNRNILVLFLACFVLSTSLLITRARTEPDAAAAGGGDAKKEAPSVEPEPTPDAEPAQNSDGDAADGKAPAPGEEEAAQGSASEEEGDQKEPKTAESEPEQDQGETTEQKEAREEQEMAEQDEEKKDPKKTEEKEKEEVEGRETIEEEEKKDDGGDDDDDDDPKGDEQQAGEDKKADQQKVDEKIEQLCKAAKDPNLCFNSILAIIGNKKFPTEEINPDWVLKMQVNATIAQLVHIQTFIRDMLKQRPQDQILIKCKDAYFNFANELGNKANAGDRAGLKTLATSGPKTLDTDCTSLVDAQPQATTPDIANTLKDVPTTSAPYLLNIAQLADTPKRKRK